MKKKFWLFVVLAGLLAGCTAGDDTARIIGNYGDDIFGKVGDDIINNADILIGTPILQSQDEVARATTTYLDDLLRNKPASQDIFEVATTVAQSADNLPRNNLTALANEVPPLALYQNANRVSQLQEEFIQFIASENNLNREDAILQLQTICWITDYINLIGEYPNSDYGLLYLNLQFLLNNNQPEWMAMTEFAQQASEYAISWINNPSLDADTVQQGAEILFNGVCLTAP